MRTVGMGAEKKLDALEKLKAEKEALLKENEELRKTAKTKSAKTLCRGQICLCFKNISTVHAFA